MSERLIKLSFKGCKKVKVPPNIDFFSLHQKFLLVFPALEKAKDEGRKIEYQYKDEEKEWITFSTNEEIMLFHSLDIPKVHFKALVNQPYIPSNQIIDLSIKEDDKISRNIIPNDDYGIDSWTVDMMKQSNEKQLENTSLINFEEEKKRIQLKKENVQAEFESRKVRAQERNQDNINQQYLPNATQNKTPPQHNLEESLKNDMQQNIHLNTSQENTQIQKSSFSNQVELRNEKKVPEVSQSFYPPQNFNHAPSTKNYQSIENSNPLNHQSASNLSESVSVHPPTVASNNLLMAHTIDPQTVKYEDSFKRNANQTYELSQKTQNFLSFNGIEKPTEKNEKINCVSNNILNEFHSSGSNNSQSEFNPSGTNNIEQKEIHNSGLNNSQSDFNPNTMNSGQNEFHNPGLNNNQSEFNPNTMNSNQNEFHNPGLNNNESEFNPNTMNSNQNEFHNSGLSNSQNEFHNPGLNNNQSEFNPNTMNSSQNEFHNSGMNNNQSEFNPNSINQYSSFISQKVEIPKSYSKEEIIPGKFPYMEQAKLMSDNGYDVDDQIKMLLLKHKGNIKKVTEECSLFK